MRIGGNGPRSLEILLIHHDLRCLAPDARAVMPVLDLWFRQTARPRGRHLGGNCRERQPKKWKATVFRYLLAAKLACSGIFWLSENAIVMALDAERMPGLPLPRRRTV
jgi:hypothetical protein